MKAEIKENIYSVLIDGLFRMEKKMIDRDSTIMRVFPYENFDEYVQENQHWFIFSYSDIDNFYHAVFRNYILNQLNCVTKECASSEIREDFEKTIFDLISENLDSLKQIVNVKWCIADRIIIKLNEHNKLVFGKSNT